MVKIPFDLTKHFFDKDFAEWMRRDHGRHSKFNNIDPRIGPHEGRYVELLLSGKKPVCSFTYPSHSEDILPLIEAVERGQLIFGGCFDCSGHMSSYKTYYFCQPGQEENMAELIALFQDKQSPATVQYHTRVGQLLGYSEDEINFFLERSQKLRSEKEKGPKP